MSRRPAKLGNVKRAVADAVGAGLVRFSVHALQRMNERDILALEVSQALTRGYHEARKDNFDELHDAWNYALRGKTVEGRNLRIAVAIEDPDVIVVTAIDLDKE